MDHKIDRHFYQKVGNELDTKRKQLGYSYRYLASLTGISRTNLDQLFMGKFRINDDNFRIICEALELNPEIKVEVSIGGVA